VKPTLALTSGDVNGIGPEVALKALRHPGVMRSCTPVLVGPEKIFHRVATRLGASSILSTVRILDPGAAVTVAPGAIRADAGRVAAMAIRTAVELVRTGAANAIVTAPVSKQALHLASYDFPGQTEMLQHLTGAPDVAMMLVSRTMRVGLATIHVPLNAVASLLTRDLLHRRIGTIHAALTGDWNIRRPRLAVLGLNPHAGEGGDMGSEEEQVIIPVIKELRRGGMQIDGPFPADAFFGRLNPGDYDAIVAMYHDQGLIPLKMSARGTGVNVSVGLPIVRTSPDHGTAFDIAGKGKADERSMVEAIRVAVTIARNRSTVTTRRPS
jgi:4-hydroxythreonine-4-phosphate dehydrogenase